jgi:hypothetical protein
MLGTSDLIMRQRTEGSVLIFESDSLNCLSICVPNAFFEAGRLRARTLMAQSGDLKLIIEHSVVKVRMDRNI